VLHSRCCEGWLVHARQAPVHHHFNYRVWMTWIDIDTLDCAPRRWYWSRWHPSMVPVRQRDYLPGADTSADSTLRGRLQARLVQQGHPAELGPVFLLTQPRGWGSGFNPVSFFFCFDASGALETIVAEVTNTPWRERFTYVLDARSQDASTRSAVNCRFELDKAFHVSPFMDMNLHYRWHVRLDDARIRIDMRLFDGETELFRAGLYLACRPLTRATAARAAWRFPAQNLVNLLRIYWQAFQLWRKGTDVYTHPDKRKPV
jgi:uncharacterized protein